MKSHILLRIQVFAGLCFAAIFPNHVVAEEYVPAMTLEAVDDALVVGGSLNSQRFAEFSELIETRKPSRIVFHDVIGGSVDAVYAYRKKIESIDIETQVDGNCFSACALVFLAGASRSVNTSRRAVIAFHGPRDPNGEKMPRFAAAYKLQIRNRTQGKFPADLIDLAIDNNKPDGALFLYVDTIFWIRHTWAIYCENVGECRSIRNADPYEMLVFTK